MRKPPMTIWKSLRAVQLPYFIVAHTWNWWCCTYLKLMISDFWYCYWYVKFPVFFFLCCDMLKEKCRAQWSAYLPLLSASMSCLKLSSACVLNNREFMVPAMKTVQNNVGPFSTNAFVLSYLNKQSSNQNLTFNGWKLHKKFFSGFVSCAYLMKS